MSGPSDRRLEERIVERLAAGPAEVSELFGALRARDAALLDGQEGLLHALLHRLVKDRVAHPVGHAANGGTVYAAIPASDGGPAAGSAAAEDDVVAAREAPPPVPPRSTRLAVRVASGAHDPADRGRIVADVLAHDAALRAIGGVRRFGSWRLARALVRRADRGRRLVAIVHGPGERLRRLLSVEGTSLVVTLASLALLWLFVGEFRVIPSNSMRPTLVPGDRVLVRKLGGRGLPDRLSIVVFRGAEKVLVKRTIGLPGEEIQIRNGDVYVDGVILRKPDALAESIREPVLRAGAGYGGGWVAVPGTAAPALRRLSRPFEADAPRYLDQDGRTEKGATPTPRCHDVRLAARTTGASSLEIELVSDDPTQPANAVAAVSWTRDATGVERVALRRGGFAPAGESDVIHVGTAPTAGGDVSVEVRDGEVRVRAPAGEVRRALDVPAGWARIVVGGGVDGIAVDRDVHYTSDPGAAYGVETPYRVPAGHVFLLGDHSFNSHDSRYRAEGPIPLERLIGPVVFRVWPPSRIGPVR